MAAGIATVSLIEYHQQTSAYAVAVKVAGRGLGLYVTQIKGEDTGQ